MEYFDSDYNTRREMEQNYHNGLRHHLLGKDIDSSGNKATQTDRVKMDTYFMNMANTAETCLRDDNCRQYLTNTMTNQARKKSLLKQSINNDSSYSRYLGNYLKAPSDVHYKRMYGPQSVPANFKVDKRKDVAPNQRFGSLSVRDPVPQSVRDPLPQSVNKEITEVNTHPSTVPLQLRNMKIVGGINI